MSWSSPLASAPGSELCVQVEPPADHQTEAVRKTGGGGEPSWIRAAGGLRRRTSAARRSAPLHRNPGFVSLSGVEWADRAGGAGLIGYLVGLPTGSGRWSLDTPARPGATTSAVLHSPTPGPATGRSTAATAAFGGRAAQPLPSASMAGPLISLTTDFGLNDPSVAACKGVIWRIAPDARLLDVSHGVPRHEIAAGAAVLWAVLPSLPVGVHMAVVDPGVGTARRPIVLRTVRGDRLVGPDNGLLLPGAERLGGVVAAHALEAQAYRLATVSRTFHGRDIFAPAAAHIANGIPDEAFGPEIDLATLVRLDTPAARTSAGVLEATVGAIDSFGNVQLLAGIAELEAALGPIAGGDALVLEPVGAGGTERDGAIGLRWRLTYGEAGADEPLACLDSYERIAVAINRGSAADRYGLRPGRPIRIRRDA